VHLQKFFRLHFSEGRLLAWAGFLERLEALGAFKLLKTELVCGWVTPKIVYVILRSPSCSLLEQLDLRNWAPLAELLLMISMSKSLALAWSFVSLPNSYMTVLTLTVFIWVKNIIQYTPSIALISGKFLITSGYVQNLTGYSGIFSDSFYCLLFLKLCQHNRCMPSAQDALLLTMFKPLYSSTRTLWHCQHM